MASVTPKPEPTAPMRNTEAKPPKRQDDLDDIVSRSLALFGNDDPPPTEAAAAKRHAEKPAPISTAAELDQAANELAEFLEDAPPAPRGPSETVHDKSSDSDLLVTALQGIFSVQSLPAAEKPAAPPRRQRPPRAKPPKVSQSSGEKTEKKADANDDEPSLADQLAQIFEPATPVAPPKPVAMTPTKTPLAAPSKPSAPPAESRRITQATPNLVQRTKPPPTPPQTMRDWRAHEHRMRSLARQEDSEKVSAVFRLDPQNSGLFKQLAAHYEMDVLLATPTRGAYAIIPHDKSLLDRTQYWDQGAYLRRNYGLSIRGLDFPWLKALRDEHVSTQLIAAEIVEISFLIPKRNATVIMGAIVAGCRALGHSLDDVRACYGTFVERWLDSHPVFEYVVTRLVLTHGEEIVANVE